MKSNSTTPWNMPSINFAIKMTPSFSCHLSILLLKSKSKISSKNHLATPKLNVLNVISPSQLAASSTQKQSLAKTASLMPLQPSTSSSSHASSSTPAQPSPSTSLMAQVHFMAVPSLQAHNSNSIPFTTAPLNFPSSTLISPPKR